MIGTTPSRRRARAHVEPVEAGQAEVQDDQVRPPRPRRAQRGRAVECREDGEAAVLQVVADELHDPRLIVNHENGQPHGFGGQAVNPWGPLEIAKATILVSDNDF